MTLASGVGSMPGEDARAYAEAVRLILGELSLPHVPELPARGAPAGMIGRTLGLVELGADLQPAGWRLTGSGGGIDQRRAESLLAQDLDAVEEAAQDYVGPFKTQIVGPWTLAATVERPRGDRLLADHGARRELAQALMAAVPGHLADLRKRVPGATSWILQIDEPALPSVLGGRVPTASGFSRHRSVDPQAAGSLLEELFAAVSDAGAAPVVHCCADDTPWELLDRAGVQGFIVDAARLGAVGTDAMGAALEAGKWAMFGLLDPGAPVDADQLSVAAERFLDLLGLDPGERFVLTPSCGLARQDAAGAVRAVKALAQAARSL